MISLEEQVRLTLRVIPYITMIYLAVYCISLVIIFHAALICDITKQIIFHIGVGLLKSCVLDLTWLCCVCAHAAGSVDAKGGRLRSHSLVHTAPCRLYKELHCTSVKIQACIHSKHNRLITGSCI